ncbi:MAG: AraC family ligand binding domain-containing protein [Dehalococcoidia bacterium]|nr:AraC family ligand binding domain-containing protein [Dehalococcoidia bacterium]
MAEREATRTKEAEAKPVQLYEQLMDMWRSARERAKTGKVVVRGKEQPWEDCRQGHARWYLHDNMPDVAVRGWFVFMQDLHSHSGKHVHQGGLAIYIVEGQGYTVIDGVKYEWEGGDLLLLPIKPHGVEHQHFNTHLSMNTKWIGLIYGPFFDAMGDELEQKENQPGYHG